MTYKLPFLTLLAVFIFTASFSQDILVLRNGDEIKVKVIEILPDIVKYKKWDNQDGPPYSEFKKNIFMIKYQNGSKDVFKEENSTNQSITSNTNNTTGNESAVAIVQLYFENKVKKESNGTLALYSFQKVNGQEINLGTKAYVIYYKLQLQALGNGYLPYSSMTAEIRQFILLNKEPQKEGWFDNLTPNVKPVVEGQLIEISGKAHCELTDNGWVLRENESNGFSVLGIAAIKYKEVQQTRGNTTTIDYSGRYRYVNNMKIRLKDISIKDELNNYNFFQTRLLNAFNSVKLLNDKAIDNLNGKDEYQIFVTIGLTYPEVRGKNTGLTYFATAILDLKLVKSGADSIVTSYHEILC